MSVVYLVEIRGAEYPVKGRHKDTRTYPEICLEAIKKAGITAPNAPHVEEVSCVLNLLDEDATGKRVGKTYLTTCSVEPPRDRLSHSDCQRLTQQLVRQLPVEFRNFVIESCIELDKFDDDSDLWVAYEDTIARLTDLISQLKPAIEAFKERLKGGLDLAAPGTTDFTDGVIVPLVVDESLKQYSGLTPDVISEIARGNTIPGGLFNDKSPKAEVKLVKCGHCVDGMMVYPDTNGVRIYCRYCGGTQNQRVYVHPRQDEQIEKPLEPLSREDGYHKVIPIFKPIVTSDQLKDLAKGSEGAIDPTGGGRHA